MMQPWLQGRSLPDVAKEVHFVHGSKGRDPKVIKHVTSAPSIPTPEQAGGALCQTFLQ